MPKINHGQIRECMLDALRGRRPAHDFAPWVSLDRTVPASANKHPMANVALALTEPGKRHSVLTWADWYTGRPLHENEALTPSESYRPDIDLATYALSGIALDAGRLDLSARLLERARAGVAYLLLGAGPQPPRDVRDHGTPGRAMIVVGDGPFNPLPGTGGRVPYIAQAGKRGHVRADLRDSGQRADGGVSSFAGPWSYTRAWALSAMVAQAAGRPYDGNKVAWEHGCFVEIRRRWPELPAWGFGPAQRAIALDYLGNLSDPDAARAVAALAGAARPALPFDFVRYTDRSIVAVALELDESSTGGVAINAQLADGRIFRASADTGGRARDDIRRQRVTETIGGFECAWTDGGGPALRVEKPRGVAEAWRVRVRPTGLELSIGGRPALDDTQEMPAPPPTASAQQTLRVRPLSPAECAAERAPLGSWLVSSSSVTAKARPIHKNEPAGELARWVIEP